MTRAHLEAESVGPAFIDYLATNWDDFVLLGSRALVDVVAPVSGHPARRAGHGLVLGSTRRRLERNAQARPSL